MEQKKRAKDSIKPGMVFGELTILYEDFEKEDQRKAEGKPSRPFYLCQCSCGRTTSVEIYCLLRGTTQSCGHLRSVRIEGKHTHDLAGQTFGNLTVIELDQNKKTGCGKHAYWICKCNLCGNTKSIRSSDLKGGLVSDCGCLHSERASKAALIDLNGKTFGNLKVLHRDMSNGYCNGVHARWMCKCMLCGRIESVASDMLLKHGKDRCKMCCGVSLGETKIVELLDSNNVSYVHDKPYSTCRFPETGGALRFDFRITDDSDCDYIIEFDGEQHTRPIPLWDDTQSFESRKRRDEFKNRWCKYNNIPLIRIPYTRLKSICMEDLMPQTSNYLV